MKSKLCMSALFAAVVCLMLSGCATVEKKSVKYPRKPNDTSSRKAGRAMYLYEQAEKDMDVTDNVIVVPPKKKSTDDKISQ